MAIKNIYKYAVAFCLLTFAVHIVNGADKPPELLKLEAHIQKMEATQKATCESDIQQMKLTYAKMLKSMQAKAQKSGNLDDLVAIQSEMKRYEASSDITEGNIVNEPDYLRDAQQKLLNAIKNKKVQSLQTRQKNLTSYSGALKRLMISLTQQDKLDEAVVVRAAMEKADADIDVIKSDPALKELTVVRKPPPKPDPEPEPVVRKPTVSRTVNKDQDDLQKLVGDWTIHYPQAKGRMSIQADGTVTWGELGKGTWVMKSDHVLLTRSNGKTFKIPRPIRTSSSKYGQYRISKQ